MSDPACPSRRRLLGSAGTLAALGMLPACGMAARGRPIAGDAEDLASPRTGTDITGELARYMASARARALPEAVAAAAKAHILDTFAAMISGARLEPGVLATHYVGGLGGTAQASVVASTLRTNAVNAALANGMCAHADETDDFNAVTKAHPGCSSVPAALAMAEKNGASGEELIRAVTLGYDLGCRLLMALGPNRVRKSNRSAEGVSATFCGLGAAAALTRLDERRMRYAISFAAQQVSGLWSWVNDEQHIEKAFDFGGMGARNGVQAVTMVEAGMTGTPNVLDGAHNLFIADSTQPNPEAMVSGLGSRFYVTETAIKAFSVGYPCQSVLDALFALRRRYGLNPDNVRSIRVKLPTDAVGIVGNSAMPDVNCQYLVALALIKGTVSFADSHSESLMNSPAVLQVRRKVQVMADAALMDPKAPRGAIVEVTSADGRQVGHHTKYPPGSVQNPLSMEALAAKARDLMEPVLGRAKAAALIRQLSELENLGEVRRLRPLFSAG
jgi:2-methylcitrate dehydratase PrpD